MLGEIPKNIPDQIKDWFGSIEITELISRLNQALGLEKEKRRIIPRALLKLEFKELQPENLEEYLRKELSPDEQKLEIALEEIKGPILSPIKKELLEYGVNIDLIGLSAEEAAEVKKNTPLPQPAPLATPTATVVQKPEAPRLIREEEKLQPVIGEKYYSPLKPSFYKPEEAGAPENQPPAVKLEFNLGQAGEKPREAPRVVNYSELKTPLPANAPLIAREVPSEPQLPKVQPENTINLKDLPK
jgi:hypothetical protein